MKAANIYDADIVIVGAGMAGNCAAYLLGKQGFSVLVIDRHSQCPPVFRAEKLEPDQAALLRKFGLLEERRPLATPIGTILRYENGVLETFDTREQYGIRYHETVNQIRTCASRHAQFHLGRVQDVRRWQAGYEVSLDDGTRLSARLVILACGYRAGLLGKLGIAQRCDNTLRSLSFGFDIKPRGQDAFTFNGCNYHLDSSQGGVDYITIFRIGTAMRANIFTQFSSGDVRIKAFMAQSNQMMQEWFPRLTEYTGEFAVTGKVKTYITRYYRVCIPKGLDFILIGDAFQSVSPTTGTGLSKVLNDVDVLCHEFIPNYWYNPQRLSKILHAYYHHEQKQAADQHSRDSWRYYRRLKQGKSRLRSFLERTRLVAMIIYLKRWARTVLGR